MQRPFETLPEGVARQLSDRDPHGNVQVSLHRTERPSDMVEANWTNGLKMANLMVNSLLSTISSVMKVVAQLPSNFDANYCYALGVSASQLIANGKTGYMAIIKYDNSYG